MMYLNRWIFHQIFSKFSNFFRKREFSFAFGVSSLVDREQGLHIVFLDYDKNDFVYVLKDVVGLIRKFELKDCFIYKTRKGFHVIFPYDVLVWEDVKKILYSAKVDWRSKSLSGQYGRIFLRVAGKYKDFDIKRIAHIISPNTPNKHEKMYGDGIIKLHEKFFNVHSVFPKKCLFD